VAGRRYVTQLLKDGFRITLMEGNASVASIGVGDIGPRDMKVRQINVVPGAQRQRIGTGLYERAAKIACKEYGVPLASDTDRSAKAEAFWKKQEAKGRAERRESRHGEYYALSCPAPRSLAGARRRRHA